MGDVQGDSSGKANLHNVDKGDFKMALKICKDLLLCLQEKKLRVAHWKGNLRLNESLEGKKDLDLLVHRGDSDEFNRVVKNLGAVKVESQPWAKFPDIEDWLVFDADTGIIVHLHVHYEMLTGLQSTKHLLIPLSDLVFSDCSRHGSNGWPVPSPAVELTILLVRLSAKRPLYGHFTKSKRVLAKYWDEFLWLRQQTGPVDFEATLIKAGISLNEKICHLIFSPTVTQSDVMEVSIAVNKQFRPFYRMDWPEACLHEVTVSFERFIRRNCNKYWGPTRFRKRLNSGFIMALVGCDGAGKSTLSQDLNGWLQHKCDSHLLYMGSGDGNTGVINTIRKYLSSGFHVVKKLLFCSHASTTRQDFRFTNTDAPSQGKIGFARRLYSLFDLSLAYHKCKVLTKARAMADSGSIFIADRYPQIQFLGINDGPLLQGGESFSWVAKLEKGFFSKSIRTGPDIVLKLIISPKVALARKPDHNLFTLERKAKIITELCFDACTVIDLNAELPYEEVLLNAKRAVWDKMVTDFSASS